MSLLVLGGGPAGATAAMQARELGADVTLLEGGQVGGTSLNRGPAPVRTLTRRPGRAGHHGGQCSPPSAVRITGSAATSWSRRAGHGPFGKRSPE